VDLFPEAADASGYKAVTEDLEFLGITSEEYERWARRETPLRIATADYSELCRSLSEALEADNITDADVRLQGSAVRFYSSIAKPMLYSRSELVDEFKARFNRLPTPYEADRMEARLQSRWGAPGPVQRPFDSLFVIGAALEPSDLDFQVSSADARQRLESAASELRITLAEIRSTHETYNFFVKDLVERSFIHLSLWRTYAMELVRRPVSIAMFDQTGPPVGDNELSSHFKESDWKVPIA
jgi:hypothetical protein